MNFIYFSVGIIFFQLLYVAIHYILFRQKEFLYFIFFSICITSFCISRIFPDLNPFRNQSGEEILSSLYALVVISVTSYLKFIQIFLNLEQDHPRINKWYSVFQKILVSFGLLIILFGLLSLKQYSLIIFRFFYILSLPIILGFIIYIGIQRKVINRIVLTGTLIAIFVARFRSMQYYFSGEESFRLIDFNYFIACVVILLLFLNVGLIYKSKLISIQNLQLEIQKQLELSNQRTMISADLHDDLGGSLSSIHLNAVMTQKSLHTDLPKSDKSLKKIIEDLKSVIQNMGDVIWAIGMDKKEHKSISGQLKDFYFDLMDDYNIQCNYHIDENIESQITNIIARKNLLLISKEGINNILKHAHATRIDFTIVAENDLLILTIQDNGVGMEDSENNFKGNGLKNMKYRAEKIHGKLTINSEVGVGTIISCTVPLTNIRYLPSASI